MSGPVSTPRNISGFPLFDAPITLGRIFVLQQDKLYILLGAEATFLRGGSPVFPFGGIIWIPSKDWRLMAVPPNPRLIYSATKTLDLWVGGELVGASFARTMIPLFDRQN